MGFCTQSKSCTQYVSKSGRPRSSHRTGQSSSQFPRRPFLKNIKTIGQLHSYTMLVRSSIKSCVLGLSITWTKNFQMSKLGLEKEEESEIKLPTFSGSWRKQGKTSFLKNTYLCFIDYTKAFGCVDHNKLWRTLKEMEIPLSCLLRN